jgi:thiol-disulfide isomerase/thioredoxin
MLLISILSIAACLITSFSRSVQTYYITFSVVFLVYLLLGAFSPFVSKKTTTLKKSIILLLPFLIDNLSGQCISFSRGLVGFYAYAYLIVIAIGVLSFMVGNYFGQKKYYAQILIYSLLIPYLFYAFTPHYLSRLVMLPTQLSVKDYNFLNEKQQNISIKDFHGKVIIINGWYTSCGYCKLYYPIIQKLHDKYKNDSKISFYALNVGLDNFEALSYFRSKYPYTFPLLYDQQKEFAKKLIRQNAAPFIVVIDQQGIIRYKCEGYQKNEITAEMYESIIEDAIKKIY